jgi:DNA polymerase-3 subunit epsilon
MKIQVESEALRTVLDQYQKQNPDTGPEDQAFQSLLFSFLNAPDPNPADYMIGLKLKRPLITFDLETTGLDVVNDRIISLGYKKIFPLDSPNVTLDEGVLYFNPGIVIPAEATAVHGITNDMVKNNFSFASQSAYVWQLFAGCDVATFNGNHYDIQLLSEEFVRAGVLSWPAPDMRSIDVKNIFVKMEGRSLTDAHQYYLGEPMEGNHDAGADTEATFRVLKAQLARYPDLGSMTLDELHEFSKMNPNAVDLAGKIALDAEGDYIYTFGKHINKKIKNEPGYARWMLDSDFPGNTKLWLEKILDKCCRHYM